MSIRPEITGKSITIEERIADLERITSSIGQFIKEDPYVDCYNKECILKIIENTIEASKTPIYVYCLFIRTSDDLRREVGNEQMKIIESDIFTASEILLSNSHLVECGIYDKDTMIIVSGEDLGAVLKDLIIDVLSKDYVPLKGIYYSVGGTVTIPNDSLPAILARLEFAVKKTDTRSNQVIVLNAKT